MRVAILTTLLLLVGGCQDPGSSSQIDWFAARKSYEYAMVDRVANAGVESFLIQNSEARERLNSTGPDQDLVNIGDSIRASIEAARLALAPVHNDDYLSIDDAAALLIPNIISLDLTADAHYPNNGRGLSDDYFDRFLEMVFGSSITDGIQQIVDASAEFPFLKNTDSGL